MTVQHTLGVDVGGTKILAGVVDRAGEVARLDERPTPVSSTEELLAELDDIVDGLLDDDVAAIGFGIPSTIDQRTGRAINSVHVPLVNVDFRERMAARYSVPVAIDNDGNAAAIAEWQLGAGRGASDLVVLTLGTGIGGGLILGGRPYRGWIGAGAELGHIVIDYGGEPCGGGCTGRGHFEGFAAGSAADVAAVRRYGVGSNGKTLVDAALAGDEGAREDLERVGRHLGAGLGSLVNIFNPEVIVIGGSFAAAGDLILDSARETLAREGLPPMRDLVRIESAQLGREAGMIGAALVAFEALNADG